MTPQPRPRGSRPQIVFAVIEADSITEHLVRGKSSDTDATDRYVKTLFAKPELVPSYGLDALRERLHPKDSRSAPSIP